MVEESAVVVTPAPDNTDRAPLRGTYRRLGFFAQSRMWMGGVAAYVVGLGLIVVAYEYLWVAAAAGGWLYWLVLSLGMSGIVVGKALGSTSVWLEEPIVAAPASGSTPTDDPFLVPVGRLGPSRIAAQDDSDLWKLVGYVVFGFALIVSFWQHRHDASSSGLGLVLGFACLLATVNCVPSSRRRFRYGRSRLRLGPSPVRLGEVFDVVFERADRLAPAHSLELTLRCREEAPPPSRLGRGELRRRDIESRIVHEERRRYGSLEEALAAAPDGGTADGTKGGAEGRKELPIRFQLPRHEGWETNLRWLPGHYWELEIQGEMPGLGYRAVFEVPVLSSKAPVPEGAARRV